MEKNELMRAITNNEQMSHCGVQLKIHPMSYPFYIAQIFGVRNDKKRDFESFTLYLYGVIRYFMMQWIVKYPDKLQENFGHIFEFKFDSIGDVERVFEDIYDSIGKNSDLLIPVGNLKLRMKRFGSGLGIQPLSNNGGEDVHVNGTKIFQGALNIESCLVDEFIHAVECVISLPREDGANGSACIDFGYFYGELKKACCYVDWDSEYDFISGLVGNFYEYPDNGEQYKAGLSRIGKLPIAAKLIHIQNSEEKKTTQWRRGNICARENNGSFRFESGRDLCLSLSVQCPFQEHGFIQTIPPDLELGKLQHDLRVVGAMLYAQICAMQANLLNK